MKTKVSAKKTSKTKKVFTNKKSYLEYIKAHKNRFITSGILGAGILAAGVYYVKFTAKNIFNIQEKARRDLQQTLKNPDIQKDIKNIGVDVATEVIDKYVGKAVNAIAEVGNKVNRVGTNAIEVYQDTLANLAVGNEVVTPKGVIDTIIIKNVIEEMDSKRLLQIERYLLSISKIKNGCASENLRLPGAFPCSPEEKELAIKDVLEYYKNEELFKQVLDFIETEFVKQAEEQLIKEKKINPNCTKYNQELFPYWAPGSSGHCPDQNIADILISEAVKMLKLN